VKLDGSLNLEQLRDARQMVIVVFGHEEAVVGHGHRLLKAWMECSTLELRGREPLQPRHKGHPRRAEAGKQRVKGLRIVGRLVRLAVAEVGRPKRGCFLEEIIEAPSPEGFEVEQMTHIFLDGPRSGELLNETLRRDAPGPFHEARGRAT